ncbi:MAG: oligosaccharide flippase family protein, partial [Pseudomonadota bacterium]
ILTRLLTPEIFGLIALAQVFLTGVTMLSDVGVRASVIRSTRGDEDAFLRTAWSVQIARGTIIALLCCLLAWPAAQLYDEPVLFPLICVLSISSLITGFRSISAAHANRKLMLKTLTLLDLASKTITLFVTVFLAWQMQSVWALAIGITIGATVKVILSHVMLPPFAHRVFFEREALREIMGFGSWILLATLFSFLAARGQQAIYGLLVPVEVIGLMAIALLIASVPRDLFQKLLNTVVLPSFSELVRNRPHDLPAALRKVRFVTIGIAFPILFVVSWFAQPIIDLLYDDRYAAAGVILTFAALNSAVPILSTTYQNVLLAEGRSDLYALLMFVWATAVTLGIFVGFNIAGLVGSLAGAGLGAGFMFLINAAIALRRGYSTGLLDMIALSVVAAFYIFMLSTADILPAFLSPELIEEAFD